MLNTGRGSSHVVRCTVRGYFHGTAIAGTVNRKRVSQRVCVSSATRVRTSRLTSATGTGLASGNLSVPFDVS